MALQDFLGKTVEIQIIDFLAENRASTYNQSEIAECTGISRQSVNSKLPKLIYNGVIEIKGKRNSANCYQLAKNDIIRKLIGSVFENGLFVSEYENDEKTVLSNLKQVVGPIPYYEEIECFCYPDKTSDFIFSVKSPEIIEEIELPYKKANSQEYNLSKTITASA
jgi:DNA-binding MarR family transcriptional regulator